MGEWWYSSTHCTLAFYVGEWLDSRLDRFTFGNKIPRYPLHRTQCGLRNRFER
jgi:hypothetical protein